MKLLHALAMYAVLGIGSVALAAHHHDDSVDMPIVVPPPAPEPLKLHAPITIVVTDGDVVLDGGALAINGKTLTYQGGTMTLKGGAAQITNDTKLRGDE